MRMENVNADQISQEINVKNVHQEKLISQNVVKVKFKITIISQKSNLDYGLGLVSRKLMPKSRENKLSFFRG